MTLKALVNNLDELKSALKANPSLVSEQDIEGMTLLHHAAQLGLIMGRTSIMPILDILFNAPGIDFTVKDSRGNTPVHVAAICSKERVTCSYVLPAIVQEAVNKGFDFETLGEAGQSVLHIVTRTFYTEPRGILPPINSVQTVLEITNNAGLNTLSTSGSTALFYAINQCNFQAAHSLLNAGADPSIYGSEDRSPSAMLDEHLTTINHYINDDVGESLVAYIVFRDQLMQLKPKISNNLSLTTSSITASSNESGYGSTEAIGFFSSNRVSKDMECKSVLGFS